MLRPGLLQTYHKFGKKYCTDDQSRGVVNLKGQVRVDVVECFFQYFQH